MIDLSLDLKVILAAFAILTAITIALYFQWWRNRKKLSYDVLTKTSLLFASAEIKNELQVLYKGEPVEHLYLLVIKIINDGYQPIKKDDFEKPLSFIFSENSEFISFEIVRTQPNNLNVETSLKGNKLFIEPLLLNSKDSFEIKLLLNSDIASFNPDARIVGVKAIERIYGEARLSLLITLFFPVFSLLSGVLCLIVSYMRSDLPVLKGIGWVLIAVFIMSIVEAIREIIRYKKIKNSDN